MNLAVHTAKACSSCAVSLGHTILHLRCARMPCLYGLLVLGRACILGSACAASSPTRYCSLQRVLAAQMDTAPVQTASRKTAALRPPTCNSAIEAMNVLPLPLGLGPSSEPSGPPKELPSASATPALLWEALRCEGSACRAWPTLLGSAGAGPCCSLRAACSIAALKAEKGTAQHLSVGAHGVSWTHMYNEAWAARGHCKYAASKQR